jgi:2-polyprenyl-3-methyl-5-hydroxy-6-metoxy-1,4-benzoquinol methylase
VFLIDRSSASWHAMNIAQSYDALAGVYHLIFNNWDVSIRRQALVLTALLGAHGGISPPARVLDCACGIGTQAIGLAQQGFQVTGSDISSAAIARARAETAARGLKTSYYVADMLDLAPVAGGDFDAVICMDNSLPYLTEEEQLFRAATEFRRKLRPGGVLLVSIRDYDDLLTVKPTIQEPYFFTDENDNRRIVFQIWDWQDERKYVFHLYITRQQGSDWQTFHSSGLYRAVRREELSSVFQEAGFRNVRWFAARDTGFYQPILVAEG